VWGVGCGVWGVGCGQVCIRWLSEVEALYVEFRKVPKAEVNHGLSPPDNSPESRHCGQPPTRSPLPLPSQKIHPNAPYTPQMGVDVPPRLVKFCAQGLPARLALAFDGL